MNRRDFLKFLRDGAGTAVVAATVGVPEVEAPTVEVEEPEDTPSTPLSLDEYAKELGLADFWPMMDDTVNYITDRTSDDTIYIGGDFTNHELYAWDGAGDTWIPSDGGENWEHVWNFLKNDNK